MQFLDARLRFLIEVLSVPWVLTDEEIETLRDDAEKGDERALEDKRRAERAARKKIEREERHARAIVRRGISVRATMMPTRLTNWIGWLL